MWRSYVAAFLFVFTVAGGFYMHHYTAQEAQSIADQIPLTLQEAREDGRLDKAFEAFNRKASLLSTFYVHSALDEIAEVFEECFTYMGLQNDEEYQAQARRLYYLLYRLPSMDDPNLENIF